MSSKKKTIVESIDNSKSNSSGSGNSSNRNDVKLLMNTLMKIIKSNNDKNAIDDKRETIIDILNQLKYLPLVTVVDIDDNDDDNNNNNGIVQAAIKKKKGKIVIEKLFIKLRKLNTYSVIDTLLEELIHKCKDDDKGHVSKVSTSEGDDREDGNGDGIKDAELNGRSSSNSSNGGSVKMKKVISSSGSNDENNQIGVRKTSRVAKNKVSSYNEDELAEQNIIIDSTSISGTTATNSSNNKGQSIDVSTKNQPIPLKNKDGILIFPDYPQFKPNLTPKEILQLGSFGGTYFRIIKSGVTGQTYHDAWKEFPIDWYDGLDIKKYISSSTYDKSLNYYKAKCGGDLHMWESSGWITEVDPFGWFQWYCRFYLGRRCSDDSRQVGRALGVMGETGRWRNNLINKCLSSLKPVDKVVDDVSIAPVVRQLLQHWGYRLTKSDLLKVKSKH